MRDLTLKMLVYCFLKNINRMSHGLTLKEIKKILETVSLDTVSLK